MRPAHFLMGGLWLIVAVLIFGDVGIERPGRFGLDWGHFVVLAVLYLGILGVAILNLLLAPFFSTPDFRWRGWFIDVALFAVTLTLHWWIGNWEL